MADISIIVEGQMEQALREYMLATRKDMRDVLNRAGRNVAFKALEYTRAASADELTAQLLSPARTEVRITKRGKNKGRIRVRQVRDAGPDSLAARIVKARIQKTTHGRHVPPADVVELLARRLVQARRKSVGFMRQGWLAAARAFIAASRTGGGDATRDAQRVPKGYGIPATEETPVAELGNNAIGRNPSGRAALRQYGEPALRRAMAEVAIDMQEYAQRKMQETARKFSAAVGSFFGS
jgi:hypothetical protein